MTYRIIIADDHTLFRDTLKMFFERAKSDVDTTLAKNIYDVFTLLEDDDGYDLVLLDLRMPGMNGLEGFLKLRQRWPDMKVAIISGLAEPKDVKEAMEQGAVGYFPKTLSGKALVKAVNLVLAGEKFLPIDHNSNSIMASYHSDHPIHSAGVSLSDTEPSQGPSDLTIDSPLKLTKREKDVLQHLMKGQTNKDIARSLNIQEVTIKLHVRGLCRKLGVANRTQIVLKAQEMGLTTTL